MSYATKQDVLFDLDVSARPKRHPAVAAAEPELSDERCEAVAQPKAAKEMRRAA